MGHLKLALCAGLLCLVPLQSQAQVTSFNARTGAVTLQSSDVTSALGFTPQQVFNVTDPAYGAKCNGQPNTFSDNRMSLAQAQAIYPFVTSTSQEIDYAAIQAAVNAAATNQSSTTGGGIVLIPVGTCMINSTIVNAVALLNGGSTLDYTVGNNVQIVGYGGGSFAQDNSDVKTAASVLKWDGGPKNTTTGSISDNMTSLSVASATGAAVNRWVYITGAGNEGADYVAQITAVSGTTLTLSTVANNTVTGANVIIFDPMIAITAVEGGLRRITNSGVSNLLLDGESLAGVGLLLRGAQNGIFNGLTIRRPTMYGRLLKTMENLGNSSSPTPDDRGTAANQFSHTFTIVNDTAGTTEGMALVGDTNSDINSNTFFSDFTVLFAGIGYDFGSSDTNFFYDTQSTAGYTVTVSGSGSAGTPTLTVSGVPTGNLSLIKGDQIQISDAGAGGAVLKTYVLAISGTTVTLGSNIQTTVSAINNVIYYPSISIVFRSGCNDSGNTVGNARYNTFFGDTPVSPGIWAEATPAAGVTCTTPVASSDNSVYGLNKSTGTPTPAVETGASLFYSANDGSGSQGAMSFNSLSFNATPGVASPSYGLGINNSNQVVAYAPVTVGGSLVTGNLLEATGSAALGDSGIPAGSVVTAGANSSLTSLAGLTTPLSVGQGGTGLTTTAQNDVFAGPASGSGAPSWRPLVTGDIPSLSGTYLPLGGGTMTGTFTASDGGTWGAGGLVTTGLAANGTLSSGHLLSLVGSDTGGTLINDSGTSITSDTGAPVAENWSPTMELTASATTVASGIQFAPTLGLSANANALGTFDGEYIIANIGAAFTGTVATENSLLVGVPSNAAATAVANVNSIMTRVPGATSATTTNAAVRIAGAGGTGAAANYAIYQTGAAPSSFTGSITAGGLTSTGAVAFSPANANDTLSPTGTGTVTIFPASAGAMNNMAIGQATAAAGTFTTLGLNGHLVPGGTALTASAVTAGTGAGTSPSKAVGASCHDVACTVTITTGTGPAAGGSIFSVAFGAAYGTVPNCIYAPANANAAALSAGSAPYQTAAAGSFAVTAGATALAPSTAYAWTFQCVD